MTDKLKRILELCKCTVTVQVNEHRVFYESVEKYLSNASVVDPPPSDILKGMVERDAVVEITAYPTTPIGSHTVFHYDLDAALDMMLETLERHLGA